MKANPDDRLGVVTDMPPCFCDSCNYCYDLASSLTDERVNSLDSQLT